MTKYRKKPVVVEAIRFIAKNTQEILDWCPAAFWYTGDEYITIKTLEGNMKANPGDWIIKGVAGEFYPCKPDIFDATYEEVVP